MGEFLNAIQKFSLLEIAIVPQNYCHFCTSYFSRTCQTSFYFLGKKSPQFMTVIASNIE